MRSVAVVAFDDISPFHLSVPTLVFGRSGTGVPGDSPYEVRVCAEEPGTLSTAAGFDITVHHGLDAIAGADLVVFPGWLRGRELSPQLCDAVRTAHGSGARLVGLCLGAWAIAATGLADGRELTTHWAAAEAMALAYPKVRVRADTLWTDLGDVITSAGVAAALDCCLHIVRGDLGARAATDLARALVTAPHRNGSQAQFIPVAVPDDDTDDPIERAMVWARTHLDTGIGLDGWSREALMSRRTFTRRFRERTGTSPQQWLLQQRTDHARLLLESTDETVDRIARDTGFGSAVSLRHHFHRMLGTSPAAHRAQFRGAAQ
ncbi:helix-turn-helix domain-containing protein [Nocardia asteroides NBRC 15531]|uniref:AraC family transcriptional regulator n=1 Tax=Nocardia asteroides NBRC 15531 TaxID=1110697 RepID=U5EM72_NOCAS|nr:helix-turn-helix domain-containing protein [Nocardia asteroides]TLF63663.1 helix-turn-helix domain-containing protein [Nocardia asteroides NBRC 15531]UGT46877.1 helix-turn-helix domain-containing protein [Nocardia asteroides]SFM85867.1 transcriptional regulator, AraC family with amidase-like domain [Nocardia asteroides]VEG34266.1 Bacillibactin transport regulator [Nocardia asteroides]GAD87428.1 putative AraC family transcriptional regulator [Nocardia asteroides NBRC 15531]